MPDGTPYEAYSLSTLGGGTLTVSVSGTAFQPLLIVRAQDGTALATDPASISIPVTAASNYQVVVATADTTGAYQLITSFQPNATETCVPQKTLPASASDASDVTASSCSMVVDSAGDEAYFNYYSLTVSQTGLADISVSSSDFAPTLYLLDAAGNTLAIDSGGGGTAGSSVQSDIRLQLSPGNYTVEVFSNFAVTGNYNLSYTLTPGAPEPCLPALYAIGAAQSGTISPASCRTKLGLADIYSLTLPAAGVLTLTMSAAAFPSQVAIRDAKDNLVVMNQDVQGLGVLNLPQPCRPDRTRW